MEQQQLTFEVVEQVRIGRHRIARIDRQPDATRTEHAQQRQEGDSAIGRQDADMATGAETVMGDCSGNGLRHGRRLGIGHCAGIVANVDEGQIVRVKTYCVIEVIDDPHGKCTPLNRFPLLAFSTQRYPRAAHLAARECGGLGRWGNQLARW
ncbi:hypothetical protein D3C81_1406500 [compost metagenome]